MPAQGVLRCALLGAALFSAPAAATVIDGDIWYQFSYAEAGSPALGCDPADPAGGFCIPSGGTPTSFAPPPPWEIALTQSGSFTVTDAFLSGDEFDVFDFGVPIGSTSAAGLGASCGDDPVPCLADPQISSGVFPLLAGAHSLTIVAADALEGGGTGYFRVGTEVAAIPEPGSLVLLGAAAALLHLRRAKRGGLGLQLR